MLTETRQFLARLPVLADLIESALQLNPPPSPNPDEFRDHLSELQRQVFLGLQEGKAMYRIELAPTDRFVCPECEAELTGGYWELANAGTGRRAMFQTSLMHGFTEHGTTAYDEPLLNMAKQATGERELKLDMGLLMRLLSGATLPPEVSAELAAFVQNPKGFAGGKLAAR